MKRRTPNVVLGLAVTSTLLAGSVVAAAPPAAAAAASSDSSAPSAARAREVVYAGEGRAVHLSTVDRRLGATGETFRRFVTAQLKRTWRQMGGSAECRQAPTLTVKKWRSDGFATIPHFGTRIAGCGAGSHHALFVKTARGWRSPTLLGGHESAFCTDLLAYRVPAGYALGECYPDVGAGTVRYRAGADLPPAVPHYAARTLVRNVMGTSPVGAGRWARPTVVDQLFETRNEGARLTVRLCVKRSDPTYGEYLGRARRGCIIRAAYYESPPPALPVYAHESMMPMKRAALGRWRGLSLVGIGGS